MLVFGMCAALGGLAQINPVWLYGPYDPSQVSAASQPDFYIGFLDGSTRLLMPWEFRGCGRLAVAAVLADGRPARSAVHGAGAVSVARSEVHR